MCNCDGEERELVDYNETFDLKGDRELVVRGPKVVDAEDLLNYLKIVDGETKFLAREVGELTFTVEQEESFISGMVDNKDRKMFIATVDGKIIGNCSVGLVNKYKRFQHRASVGIAIQRQYWGLGIGKILMLKCIAWCKNNGVEQLELEVVTSNERAIGMYKKLGFEIQGTAWHSLKYGEGNYADEYCMVLDFAEKVF